MVAAADDRLQEFEPVALGKHEVEQDEFRPKALQLASRTTGSGSAPHAEAVAYQVVTQPACNGAVVLNDQQSFRHSQSLPERGLLPTNPELAGAPTAAPGRLQLFDILAA